MSLQQKDPQGSLRSPWGFRVIHSLFQNDWSAGFLPARSGGLESPPSVLKQTLGSFRHRDAVAAGSDTFESSQAQGVFKERLVE